MMVLQVQVLSIWAPAALEEVEAEMLGVERNLTTSACKQRRISSSWCEAENASCRVSPVVIASSDCFRRPVLDARFIFEWNMDEPAGHRSEGCLVKKRPWRGLFAVAGLIRRPRCLGKG